MKTKLGVVATVLAFCCVLVVGPAVQARAAECTTQGALALALADVVGSKVTSAQAAADALAAIGVGPTLGWNVEACLTDAVSLEISAAYAALNRDAGGFERALGMIGTGNDKSSRSVSPHKP